MKKSLLILSFSIALSYAANAAAIVNLFAGQLFNSNGTTPMANGGLLQVIASTSDNAFYAPTIGSFVGGNADNIIAFSYAMNSATTGQTGSSLQGVTLTYAGAFGVGDFLLLRWWPTLTISSPSPGAGTPYGEFRTASIVDGSTTGWIAPADGGTVSLNFATGNAGGSQPNSAGTANLATAPEPTSAALLTLGLVSLASRRRRQVK